MNVSKLKGKIVEHGSTQEAVAKELSMSRSTFYRKLKNNGMDFTIGEVHKMVDAIPLTSEEAMDIFFTQ